VRYTVVGINVFYSHGAFVEHSPTADAGVYGEPASFPEGAYSVFIGIVAKVFVAQHEGGAIGTGKLACGGANYVHNGLEIAGQRKLLYYQDQMFHTFPGDLRICGHKNKPGFEKSCSGTDLYLCRSGDLIDYKFR
jgi:hypothetical protein